MRIGLPELIVIIIVAIALIKPEKLRGLMKNAAKAMKILKEETSKMNETVEPIKEAVKPVTDLKDEVNNTVTDIKKTVSLDKENNK